MPPLGSEDLSRAPPPDHQLLLVVVALPLQAVEADRVLPPLVFPLGLLGRERQGEGERWLVKSRVRALSIILRAAVYVLLLATTQPRDAGKHA